MDKLSTRVTKIQSDSQLRFTDLEILTKISKNINSNGVSKIVRLIYQDQINLQDFGAAPGYKTSTFTKQQGNTISRNNRNSNYR